MSDKLRVGMSILIGLITAAEASVLFVVLAWSLFLSFSALSLWTFPILGLCLLSILALVSPKYLRRIPRLQSHSEWAPKTIRLILLALAFAVWVWFVNGPAISYKYYLHTATWKTSSGNEIVFFEYRPAYELKVDPAEMQSTPRHGLYDKNRGILKVHPELVFVHDQDFVRTHRDREGTEVPIVFRRRCAFGSFSTNSHEVFSIAELTPADWRASGGSGSPESKENEIDEATALSFLKRSSD